MASDRIESPLSLRLFGPPEVRLSGDPLPHLRYRKGLWLLALLTLRHGREVDRSWLAGTLWPESTEPQARLNLRRVLMELRRALGDPSERIRSSSPNRLRIDLAGADVDLLAFDAAIDRGDPASLERALSLHRGPLLEGCAEEWVFPERDRREQACLGALETLAEHALARREPTAAAAYLRRILAADPLRESAVRRLMAALAAGGDYAAMIEAYRRLREMLHRELHIEPSEETHELFRRLRAEARRRVERPAATIGASTGTPRRTSPTRPVRRLPVPLTSLIGREREVEAVGRSLESARLVTLAGPGGIGKTRLALAVTERGSDLYPNSAGFVDLAPVMEPAEVGRAVAAALGVRIEPASPALPALVDALVFDALLIVLDNCEHVAEACVELVGTLLGECLEIRILATSRQPLGIPGEVVHRVPPLELPGVPPDAADGEALVAALERSPAARLFVERAAAAAAGFTLTARTAPAALAALRRLDGIPLAIELAAARLRALSVDELASRLEGRLDLVGGDGRARLPRHRTLRATLDWSHDLLSEKERALVRRLAIFAGGWTLDAAESVCSGEGIDEREVVDLLTGLVDRSLVIHEARKEGGRYRFLEMIRQYCRERLEASGESGWIRERHYAYYLRFLEERRPRMLGAMPRAWIEDVNAEYDNLSAALNGCDDAPGGTEARLRIIAAVWLYWVPFGPGIDVQLWKTDALDEGRRVDPLVRLSALQGLAFLMAYRGDFETVDAIARVGTALVRKTNDTGSLITFLALSSISAFAAGDADRAAGEAEEAIALSRKTSDRLGLLLSTHMYGIVQGCLGHLSEAEVLERESYAIARETGDTISMSYTLAVLGWLHRLQGRYAESHDRFRESLDYFGDIDERRGMSYALEGLALLYAVTERDEASALCFGAAEACRDVRHITVDRMEQADHERLLTTVRDRLGDERFLELWTGGYSMPIDRIVDAALKI